MALLSVCRAPRPPFFHSRDTPESSLCYSGDMGIPRHHLSDEERHRGLRLDKLDSPAQAVNL